MTAETMQLDLFGEVEAEAAANAAAAIRRRRDALTCLRDSHPRALEILLGDRPLDRGEVKCGLGRPWAYSVRKTGFYFEDYRTWGGWYSRPKNLLAWAELDALIGTDPRVDDVRAWSESLTAVDAWLDRTRPHEMWPNPGEWHPSYIEGDHRRAGWPERLHAWTTVLAILTDARAAVQGESGAR